MCSGTYKQVQFVNFTFGCSIVKVASKQTEFFQRMGSNDVRMVSKRHSASHHLNRIK